MATPSPKKSRGPQKAVATAESEEIAPVVARAKARGGKRRGKWRRLLVLMLFGTIALLAFAPWLVTRTGMLNQLLATCPAPLSQLRVGDATLAWWAPVLLSDVEFSDAQGEVLAKAPCVTSDKTLLALALGPRDLGRIAVQRPTVRLATREAGSNLEDFLASLPQSSGAGGAGISLEVVIEGGSLTLDDTFLKRQFNLGQVNVACKLATGTGTIEVDGAGSLGAAAEQPTTEQPTGAEQPSANPSAPPTIKFALSIKPAGSAPVAAAIPSADGSQAVASTAAATQTTESQPPVSSPPVDNPTATTPASSAGSQFTCQTNGLPLAILQPLLRRFLAGAQIDGELTGAVTCGWGQPAGAGITQQTLASDITVGNFSLGATALGADRLQLQHLRLPCQASLAGKSLNVQQLSVECDLGQISGNGQLQVDDLARPEVWTALGKETFHLDGKLDLARLASLLPGLLRIKPGLNITAGQATLAIDSQTAASGGAWQARLEGANLAALDGGQSVTWSEPVVIQCAGRAGANSPVVDEAQCDASFLHLKAAGSLDNLSGEGSFDLGRLLTEVSQFADLGAFQLAGTGSLNFSWQQANNQSFAANLKFDGKELQVALPNRPAWREPALSAQLDARGLLAGGVLKQLDKATLQIDGAQERLTIDLTESVSQVATSPWPMQVSWQGPMNGWTGRLALWLDVAAWELAGDGNLAGVVVIGREQIEFQDCHLSADRLHVWLPGLYLDEPRLEITTAGAWTITERQLSIPNLVAVCGQAGVRLTNLNWSADATGVATTSGEIAYKAEINELLRWTRDPRRPSSWNVTGTASGSGKLSLTPGVSSASLSGVIDNLQVAANGASAPAADAGQVRWLPVSAGGQGVAPQAAAWSEQQLKLGIQATYDHARDLLQITQAGFSGSTLSGSLTGSIAALNTDKQLDLKGEVEYDWGTLAPLLTPYIGSRVMISGHDRRPFSLQGPWKSPSGGINYSALTGSAGFGWSEANIYGLPIGPGQLVGALSGGVLRFQPLDLMVSGGQVNINEQWRIAPAPGELQMPKGRLVDRVQVTPEVCAQALRYVAPILSQVTRAEGAFSIDIEGGRLPFGDARGCDVLGHLLTDQAHVQAGPLAQQFALLAQKIESLLLSRNAADDQAAAAVIVNLANENVDFRVVGGRAYHRNLKFQIGILQIATQGSVGFDESLSMLAEVGLADSLLEGRPLLAGLKNHPLQIPLTGSLNSPHLDTRALEQLVANLAQNTAKAVVEKPLELLGRPLQALERPLQNLAPH